MGGYAGSSPESSLYAYILSKKSLATPDCFAPYLENVATKEYFYKCLETGFIFEEFCVKILMLVAIAENSEAGYTKITLSRYVSLLKSRTAICNLT